MITKDKKVDKKTESPEKMNWNYKLFKNYPDDWNRVKLGDILIKVKKPVKVEDSEYYEQIGIRSHCKGIFNKEKVLGKTLGNKSVFWIEPDCFILNIVFAWEHAIAKTTEKEKGKIASHRFPMWKPKNNLDLQYLLYFFKSPVGKHLLAQASPGGAGRNKTLGQEDFNETLVCIPKNIKEQKKIVEIIETWDKAISLKEELIKEKKLQKKYLMQKLLTGKKRFKEFIKNSKYKQTKIGLIPNDWEVVKYENACNKIFVGIATSTTKYFSNNNGVILIRNQNIKENKLDTKDLIYITQEFSNLNKNKKLHENDILTVRTGYPGLSCVVTKEFKNCQTFTTLVSRPKLNNFSPHFISYFFNSDIGKGQVEKLEAGGAQRNLNAGAIINFLITKPQLSEQEKIASVLSTCDQEIELLQQELDSLKEQKKGLMQLLLTGKVRVNINN